MCGKCGSHCEGSCGKCDCNKGVDCSCKPDACDCDKPKDACTCTKYKK